MRLKNLRENGETALFAHGEPFFCVIFNFKISIDKIFLV